MRLDELSSIWNDIKSLSNRDKACVFALRAEETLDRARKTGDFPRNLLNKISREWLCEAIGCRRGSLRQNTAIRLMLETFDNDHASKPTPDHIPTPSSQINSARSNVVVFDQSKLLRERQLDKHGIIEKVEFTYDNEMYAVPTVIWRDGIDENLSDWLRRRIMEGASYNTVYEDAKSVRRFVAFCRERGWSPASIDDRRLRQYRSFVRYSEGVAPNREGHNIWARTFNRYLASIFAYFCWLETTGRIRNRVQLHSADRGRYALTGKRIVRRYKDKKRGKRISWVSSVRVPDKKGRRSTRKTPDQTQIVNLHRVVAPQRHATRNSLLYSWQEETGLRRFEVLQILVQSLPSRAELDRIRDGEIKWPIWVDRKGGGGGFIYPPVDLLERTLDYIDNERKKIVDRWKQTKGKTECVFVFLSQRTGDVLKKDSYTKIGTRDFRAAGIEDASPHRLRGSFAEQQTEVEVDAYGSTVQGISPYSSFIETILTRVAEKTNHATPEGLRPYMINELNRRARNAEAYQAHDLETEIRNKRLLAEALERRIQNDTRLQNYMEKAQAGDYKAAIAILKLLQNDLEKKMGRRSRGKSKR